MLTYDEIKRLHIFVGYGGTLTPDQQMMVLGQLRHAVHPNPCISALPIKPQDSWLKRLPDAPIDPRDFAEFTVEEGAELIRDIVETREQTAHAAESRVIAAMCSL